MLEQVDEQRVETLGLPVVQVGRHVRLVELCDQRPGRVALHQERFAGAVLEATLVGADPDRERVAELPPLALSRSLNCSEH